MRDFVRKSLFVDRSDLLQQNNGIPVKSVRSRIDLDMSRQLRFLDLRRDGGNDRRRAESVADIILDNKHWSYPALLGTHHRGEVSKKNVTALYDQWLHPAY